MANAWHDVAPKNEDGDVNVIVEVPKRSRVKYELEKETGLMKVDRVLYSPMHYPADYGFVPQTLWDDGDPLDVLALSDEGYIPGCLVEVRVIGALEMNDSGEDDLKVLSVPAKDPRWKNTKDITDLEPHILAEIKHFFQVYKDLQNKKVVVGDWLPRKDALEAVERGIELYKEKHSSK